MASARCLTIESRTAFDSFYPMEVIALKNEQEEYLKKFKQAYHLFAESREYPIRMFDALPERWLKFEQPTSFSGKAMRNEYFVFQIEQL